jgi:hypothetical protein
MQSIAAHDNVLRYQRVDANEALLILLNLSHEPVQVDASGIILKSIHGDREGYTSPTPPLSTRPNASS